MIEELYTVFYGELVHWCAAMTHGDRAAAEDLAQETFLRALTHADTVDELSRGQCRAWLRKTARNLYVDRLRRQAREVPAEQEELERASFEADMTEGMVAQLVARLPEEERTLFILRHFEGYNASELGELFSLPPPTVRARLASARRKLKKWLETK